MKKCKILRTFPGSQDGTRTETFEAGSVRELSPYLEEIAVREGWAEPVSEQDADASPGDSADGAASPDAAAEKTPVGLFSRRQKRSPK